MPAAHRRLLPRGARGKSRLLHPRDDALLTGVSHADTDTAERGEAVGAGTAILTLSIDAAGIGQGVKSGAVFPDPSVAGTSATGFNVGFGVDAGIDGLAAFGGLAGGVAGRAAREGKLVASALSGRRGCARGLGCVGQGTGLARRALGRGGRTGWGDLVAAARSAGRLSAGRV